MIALHSLMIFGDKLYKLVTFFHIARKTCFKKHRVSSELGIKKRHVAIDFNKLVHTHVSFYKVFVVCRESLWTTGTTKCPSRGNLTGECLRCKSIQMQ